MLNVGNGLALLGMTTIIGEFFLTYFAKDKEEVAKKKYDYVMGKSAVAASTAGLQLGSPIGKERREQLATAVGDEVGIASAKVIWRRK